MAKSLAQLRKQIAVLERQAESIRKREMQAVIVRIKEAIAFYELTADQLGFSGGADPARKRRGRPPGSKTSKKAGRRRKGTSPIKYRDDAGHAWTGHGRRPQWFIDAVAAGKSAESMLA